MSKELTTTEEQREYEEFEERVRNNPQLEKEISLFGDLLGTRTEQEYTDIDSTIAFYERVREAILDSRKQSTDMAILPKGLLDIVASQNSSEWLVKRDNETEDILRTISGDLNTTRAFIGVLGANALYGTPTADGLLFSIKLTKKQFDAILRNTTTHRTKNEIDAVKSAFLKLNGRQVNLRIEGQTPPNKRKKETKWKSKTYLVNTPIWSLSVFGDESNPYYVITASPLVFGLALTEEVKNDILGNANIYLKYDRKVYAPSETLLVEKSVPYMSFKAILARTTHKSRADMLADVFGYDENTDRRVRDKGCRQINKWGGELVKECVIVKFKYNAKRDLWEWDKRQPTLFDDWMLEAINNAIECFKKCKEEQIAHKEAYDWVVEHLVKDEDEGGK